MLRGLFGLLPNARSKNNSYLNTFETMKTTLKKIWQHNPCEGSWKKLLQSLGKTEADDREVSVRYILELLGIYDAIWSLRAVQGHDREMRLFACDCAESVLHIFEDRHPDDNRPRNAIEVARSHANGEATTIELEEARAAAWDAASAAWAAASDAASAASRAAAIAASEAAIAAAGTAMGAARAVWAASDAARDSEREKQRDFLLKYI